MRRYRTQPTERAYEKANAPLVSAIIELKAVELPRLINARTTTIEREKRMALIGTGVPIVVIW